jgi:hypothetical protein
MPVRSQLLKAARGKFGFLLLTLLALLVSAPVIIQGVSTQFFLAVLASTVLVAGMFAAVPRVRSLVAGLALAVVDLGIGQLSQANPAPWVFLMQAALWLGTLLLVTVIILEVVLASRPVTLQTLQAAFCVFLLLGLIWTNVYICESLIAPGSFDSPGSAHLDWSNIPARRRAFLHFLIYSYSRLSSTEYPGLTPVSDFASISACLEAMMAQVYLAVVIARLVGLQASQAADAGGPAPRGLGASKDV